MHYGMKTRCVKIMSNTFTPNVKWKKGNVYELENTSGCSHRIAWFLKMCIWSYENFNVNILITYINRTLFLFLFK